MKDCLLILAILLTALSSVAQQKKVTGTVTEKSTQTPLPGVTVQAKNQSAITDSAGRFSINAAPGETVSFSFVGMKRTIASVPSEGNILLEMERDASNLEAIVVTGYQTQKK